MQELKVTAVLKATVSVKESDSGEEATTKATEALLEMIMEWIEDDVPPVVEFFYQAPPENYIALKNEILN
jgi:hypothetical protein